MLIRTHSWKGEDRLSSASQPDHAASCQFASSAHGAFRKIPLPREAALCLFRLHLELGEARGEGGSCERGDLAAPATWLCAPSCCSLRSTLSPGDGDSPSLSSSLQHLMHMGSSESSQKMSITFRFICII